MNTRTNLLFALGLTLLGVAMGSPASAQDWPNVANLPAGAGNVNKLDPTPISLTPKKSAMPITRAEEALGSIMWGSGPEIRAGVRVQHENSGAISRAIRARLISAQSNEPGNRC